jgi:hypothetical protein
MRKMNSKNSKKNKVGNRKAGARVHEKTLELSLIRTYPGQAVWQVILPAEPLKFTTTVTTGVIASIYEVSASNITNFGGRFGSTFVEYRIIRAKFHIRVFSSTNPGVIQFWIDEKSMSTPTLAEARERATLIVPASAVDDRPLIKWVCGDTLDLQYVAIGATTNPSTLKFYTDNANFGSSIVASDYFIVEPLFEFQFRGLQGS